MKTKNIFEALGLFAVLLFGSTTMVSCLKDGEETVALEEGDAAELILGSWEVDRSEIFDLTTDQYHSDLPNDNSISKVYTFGLNNSGTVSEKGLSATGFYWHMDNQGETIDIDGQTFKLASLGENAMALESNRSVNGDLYRHRYILKKVDNSKDTNVDEPDDDDTQVVTSDEGRTFRRYGYTITVPKGAVPRNNSGGVGRVAFSIQLAEDLPTPLPNGMTLLESGNVKIEPMNFTFNSPLTIKVPLRGFNASDVCVYWYDAYTGGWRLIPFSKINTDGTASITMIELGQFVIVRHSMGTGTNQMTTGGIHIARQYIQSGYYYYLTLTPRNSSGSSKSIAFTSNGEDLYMAGIELGTYAASITRERRSETNSDATTTETATLSNVTVSTTLTKGNGGYSTYAGWTELSLSNVNWNNGRPNDWGEATKTYGTGKFQATLTWVNTNSSKTDYDLHLTTPSGEVYYGHKQAGAFELDYDWTTPVGNAIENIYSIRDDFDAGTYKVRVQHYSGEQGKRYNCRIIVNGTVVKSVTGAINTKQAYDDIYSFTIQ
ncbi:MAG: hypothetical protein ACI36X_05665 [Bacteroidaceae bacterium]